MSPQPNGAGWNSTDVTLTLDATEEPNGSGVAATFYAIDTPSCTSSDVQMCTPYTGPFSVSTEGAHTLTYFSIDQVGNAEAVETMLLRVR